MLHARIRAYFEGLGWTVEDSRVLGAGPLELRPDLVLRRGPKVKAVRCDDDSLGAYPIGDFAARCKRLRIGAVIVCPSSPDVLEACDSHGAEFFASEGLTEHVVLRPQQAPLVVPTPIAPAPAPVPVTVSRPATMPPISVAGTAHGFVWWRWAIVAAIWAAAIYVVVRLIGDILG